MSKNSRHGAKMQKRFDKEETARRERAGKMTEVPRITDDEQKPAPGEILDAPDPRTLESLRRNPHV